MEDNLEQKNKKSIKDVLMDLYENHYKKMLIFTFLILILSISQIAYQYSTTGDFIDKDVSLKGGITVSIQKTADISEIESFLSDKFAGADILVREINSIGNNLGIVVEASDVDSQELVNALTEKMSLTKDQYSVEIVGGSLGASFFREVFKSLLIAFMLIGTVVFIYFSKDLWPRVIAAVLGAATGLFIYFSSGIVTGIICFILIAALFYIFFKYSIPSVGVILAVFSNIIGTVAVVNLLGIKIGTAGIAAFLMLIGYGVDANILLTTRLLNRKDESIFSSTIGAAKTGLMLIATAVVAIVIALVLAQAEAIKQIMTIVLIGLLFDIFNTWVQNVAILRWYFERKQKDGQA